MKDPEAGQTISIHAPRVGSDISFCSMYLTKSEISIHAPRVGSDELLLDFLSV